MALIALGIHIGLVCCSGKVVDTRIDDPEDVLIADATGSH